MHVLRNALDAMIKSQGPGRCERRSDMIDSVSHTALFTKGFIAWLEGVRDEGPLSPAAGQYLRQKQRDIPQAPENICADVSDLSGRPSGARRDAIRVSIVQAFPQKAKMRDLILIFIEF